MKLLCVAGVICLQCCWVAGLRAELLIDPAGGTVLFNDSAGRDDDVLAGRPLGFAFPYFDEPVTTLDVCINGHLNGSGDSAFQNVVLATEVSRLCPLWDDLEVVAGSGDAVIEKVLPGTYYSVTWKVHERGNAASRSVFQAVLFGKAARVAGVDFLPGDIVFAYEQVGATFAKGNATVGVDSGSDAVTLPALAGAAGILPNGGGAMLLAGRGFTLFRPDGEGGYKLPMTTNVAPEAVDDVAFSRGTATGRLVIPVLANDSDADGDALEISSFTQGAKGTVSANADGTLSFQPTAGFFAEDQFTYTLRDGMGATAAATVRILPFAAVAGIYDGPLLDTESEPVGHLRVVMGNDGKLSGVLTFSDESQVALSRMFAPSGVLRTNVTDADGAVSLLVLHFDWKNGTPRLVGTFGEEGAVFSAIRSSNNPPAPADDLRYMTGRGRVSIAVLANDTDPDGDALVVSAFTQGAAGTVTRRPDGTLTYIPVSNFSGMDRFTYTVSDTLGLTATAAVTLLPIAAARGAYDGLALLADEEGTVTPESSGHLKLALTAGGNVTGALCYGGFRLALKGSFDGAGNFTAFFQLPDGVDLVLRVRLDLTAESHQITGTLSDGSADAVVKLGRSRFHATLLPAPQAGLYMVLLPASEEGGPEGWGYGKITVARSGAVMLRATLGDGSVVSCGSSLRMDGSFPLYVPLYAKKKAPAGSLFGNVLMEDTPDSDCAGALYWIKPDSADGTVEGWSAAISLLGSRYAAPARGVRVLAFADTPRNGSLDLNGEALEVTLGPDNKLLVHDPEDRRLTLACQTATGGFSGSFFEDVPDPITSETKKKKRSFKGVLLQKQKLAGGFYKTEEGTAHVTLQAAGLPEYYRARR